MNCQVCYDLASGYHYDGQPACPSCRVFFRRQALTDLKRCALDRNCIITKETRSKCKYCRYQKCLKIGMNPSQLTEGEDKVNYDYEILAKFVKCIDRPEVHIKPLPEIDPVIKYAFKPFTERDAQYLAKLKNYRRRAIMAVPGLTETLEAWMASLNNQGSNRSIQELEYYISQENYLATLIHFIENLPEFQE